MRAAFLALFLALWAGNAVAHAVLLDTTPGDGARLTAPPSSVVLRFNETVSPIAARLVDSAGGTRALAPVARGAEIEIPLPSGLAPGGYYVAWRVASADTHPIAGTLTFAIGDAMAPAPPPSMAADDWRTASVAVRALRNLTLALGVGGAAFLALVGAPRGRRVRAALALAALAILANMVLAGARIAEAAPWNGAAWYAGWASSAGSSALALTIGIAFAALPGRLGPWIGLFLVGAGTALTGHAATAQPRWLFGAAQALHVAAAIFWLGAFLPLLRELGRNPARAAAWSVRFSPAGIGAVVALTLAGAVLAAGHAANLSTDYAALLAAKAVALGALIFVAAENRNDAVPALRAGAPGAAGRFARYLRIEMALGLAVIVLAAALAHTPPVASMAHSHTPRADLSLATFRDGRMLAVERTGARLEFRLTDAGGVPIDAMAVELELAGGAIEALRRTPARLGPGHYALDDAALAMPGPWVARVNALIDDFTQAVFEIELRGR